MSWNVTEQGIQSWGEELERVCGQIALRFGWIEVLRRACLYVLGLIAYVDRKDGW